MLNPDMAFPFNNRMNTIETIINLLYTAATRFYYRNWHLPRAQQIASKIVPGTSVNEIDKNFSLVILGNNHVFGYPKPLLPNVVEVHSLQIGEKPDVLPKVSSYGKNVQQFFIPPFVFWSIFFFNRCVDINELDEIIYFEPSLTRSIHLSLWTGTSGHLNQDWKKSGVRFETF